jgi:hypothetical protein
MVTGGINQIDLGNQETELGHGKSPNVKEWDIKDPSIDGRHCLAMIISTDTLLSYSSTASFVGDIRTTWEGSEVLYTVC